jgi:tetratricopeptide (TPR) repeat protein
MSGTPERSRLARLSQLQREAQAAESAGRVAQAVAALEEVVRLDPRDRRTLHRLGDLHRARLNRFAEAASFYAREARCQEEEGFEARAIAAWRLVARCDPGRLEAYERIGALYVALGRAADARQHYERSAAELREAGLVREAAILRAHLAALDAPGEQAPAPAGGPEGTLARLAPVDPAADSPEALPDADALHLAQDRLQNGRLFRHYGLHEQARQQLEELLASLPEHLEARQLLVEVCRALGDQEAAAQHLRVATMLLRRDGRAGGAGEPAEDAPAVEEWAFAEEPADPMAGLLDEIREDVERLVERIAKGGEGR